ncbi:MAG: HD domain-containing protein [Candidatus Pacearchaeota archaeon]
MNEQFYEKLKERILPYYEQSVSHGFDHSERVLRNAIKISEGENVDIDIVKTSAILHDIARHKEKEGTNVCHAEEGAKIAEEVLRELNFPNNKIPQVVHAIKVHRYSKGLKAETREAEILQDADRLDALGSIILVRMISAASKKGIPIYDPKIPIKKEYDGSKSTVINHIYEKILKMKPETFRTKKAQEMAMKKYKLIDDFVDSYIKEVTGEL